MQSALICGLSPFNALLVYSEVTSGVNWSDCPSTTAVQDGEWHFLAATGDGEVLQVYVDGKMENEQNFGGQDFSDATVTIGGRNDGSQPINGIIDDVGLFNMVLSEEEINNIMTDGLGVATGIAAVEPVGKLTSTWGMLKIR